MQRFLLCFVFTAIIGAGLLYIIVPYESRGLLGVTQIQPVSTLVGFGVELLMTLAVTLTVLMCADGGHTTVDRAASIMMGLVVTACHLFAVIKTTLVNSTPERLPYKSNGADHRKF